MLDTLSEAIKYHNRPEYSGELEIVMVDDIPDITIFFTDLVEKEDILGPGDHCTEEELLEGLAADYSEPILIVTLPDKRIIGSELYLYPGEAVQLTARVVQSGRSIPEARIKWKSNFSYVASIRNGYVKAKKRCRCGTCLKVQYWPEGSQEKLEKRIMLYVCDDEV